MSIELKPCPFCGGKPRCKSSKYNEKGGYGSRLGIPDKQWYGIYCTSCKVGHYKQVYFTKEDAYDAWNKRC